MVASEIPPPRFLAIFANGIIIALEFLCPRETSISPTNWIALALDALCWALNHEYILIAHILHQRMLPDKHLVDEKDQVF